MLEYHVYLDGIAVGSAKVTEEGLYYKVQCRCKPPQKEIYRLVVDRADTQHVLGVLVPQGAELTLNKKIPRKNIGDGKMTFYLVCPHENTGDLFVPADPATPFHYIRKLDRAQLEYRDGTVGIIIPAE